MSELQLVVVSPIFRPYLKQSAIDSAPEKIVQYRQFFERILNPVESWVMTTQSLLVWENPFKSAVLISMVNLAFWIVSTMTNHIIAVICWGFMLIYFAYLWKTLIWPTIRVPTEIKDEEWVPMHATLLSVPELSQHMAEIVVTSLLYLEALHTLRKERKTAFLVLMMAFCSILFVIGIYISGLTLSYICVISILIWPCAVYHKVLPNIYMKIEPYLMALQYKLMSRLKTEKCHKERIDQPGDTVETDSEDDEMVPAVNPELSAAIARTITDSEDESGSGAGSPHSVTREPSVGCTSELASPEGELMPDHSVDEQVDLTSLMPDVSQMPDFENVCEDSSTFMLDTELMPGFDDVDRSRALTLDAPTADDTGSETESLPFDDIPSQLSSQQEPISISQQPHSHQNPTPENRTLLSQPMVVVPAMLNALVEGVMQVSQVTSANNDELRLDPRDRIADASAPDIDDDSDMDFELVTKEDVEGYINT